MWREEAACRGVPNDWFFVEANFGLARQVCRRCPVQSDCLEYATKTRSFGIWAGTGSAERGLYDMTVSSGEGRPAKRTATPGKSITVRAADNVLLESHE